MASLWQGSDSDGVTPTDNKNWLTDQIPFLSMGDVTFWSIIAHNVPHLMRNLWVEHYSSNTPLFVHMESL